MGAENARKTRCAFRKTGRETAEKAVCNGGARAGGRRKPRNLTDMDICARGNMRSVERKYKFRYARAGELGSKTTREQEER